MNFRYYIYDPELQEVTGTDSFMKAFERTKAGDTVIDSDIGKLIALDGDYEDIKDIES